MKMVPYLHAGDSATVASNGGDVAILAGGGEAADGLESGERSHHAGLSRGGAGCDGGGGEHCGSHFSLFPKFALLCLLSVEWWW